MNLRTTVTIIAVTSLNLIDAFAGVVISEFMASNSTTLADEDGRYSDWIEIENNGPETVNLENWYLTNKADFSAADSESYWIFPSRSLAPGQRLVVFASSKNRRPAANGELHTNFQLSADGEYLALIAPDGVSVATEFSPGYPRQRIDLSYGFGEIGLESRTLVAEGAAARVHVPLDGSEGMAWTGGSEPFDDSGWLGRVTGVGFEQNGTPGGFTLIDQFDSLNPGELDGQGGWNSPVAGATIVTDPDQAENQVLSLIGSNVRSWKSMPIADNSTATLFFRMRREGSVNASVGGSDIGSPGAAFGDFETQLNNQNDTVLNVRDAGSFDPVGAFEEDVWYEVWMVMNLATDEYQVFMKGGALETRTQLGNGGQTSFSFRNGSSGNAMANFFVRTGGSSPGTFLLDDIYQADGVNLGNPAGSPGLTNFIAEGGNIEAEMLNQASGAYLRIPFTTPSVGSFSSLKLRVRYDDGFAAYLNGTRIASRNAPQELDWESSATEDHPTQEVIVFEDLEVSGFQHLLNPVGESNILALHGLNLSPGDADFLLTPVLEGVIGDEGDAGIYFTNPTPGAANGDGVLGFVSDTEFSVDRGFFDSAFDLVIDSDTGGATLVYTLDGSTPTPSNGTQALAPVTVSISKTTPVRAMAFKSGYLQTDVDTQTYFFLDDITTQGAFPAGYPTTWKGDGGNGSETADYGMDPEISQSDAYRDLMDDALLSIPTISIVTDKEHFFDPATGIYQNPQQHGGAWERPASVEFIRPDGLVKNLQVNAGIRIQGGHTRLPSKNPKHSFRLSFKSEFGAKSLNYDLFPGDDGATTKFDQLILRGAGNQSWLHHNTFKGDNRGRAQYIRDQWAKDAQLAMSGIGLRSMYAHLYLNGIYWGMYNPSERASAGFGESYLGDAKEDYHALNAGEAIDGASARTDYNQMLALANADLADSANYESLKDVLDVAGLTDYMLINQYGGNLDWDHHNWYAIRNRNGGKWKFLCWDSEFIFISPTDNVLNLNNGDDPSGIWRKLLANDEYRLLFADKAKEHLTNEGILTPGGALGIWENRKEQMFDAIVAESARWGDYRRDVDPVGPPTPIPLYDRDEEWMDERNRLLNDYFPFRTATVLQQYRSAGYLPATDAPVFDLPVGLVSEGALLHITSGDGGEIFYTIDGSDPRLPAQASELDLLPEGAAMKVLVPLSDALGTSWQGGAEPYDDGAWRSGTAAGFETGNGPYSPLFDLDLKDGMYGKSPSCYVRMTFEIPDQVTLEQVSGLNLAVRYDDGFAAFVNGVRVASDNVPDPLTWNAGNGSHSDSLAVVYQPFILPAAAVGALQVGTNVLAFHAFNSNVNSNDFLFDATLSAELTINVSVSPGARAYRDPIPINGPTIVKARVRDGASWSALTSAAFYTAIPAAAGNLVISEVMYHPAKEAAEEFLELENISQVEIDLTGVYLSEGVSFTFPFGATLAPGERVLVVRDRAAFELRYGTALSLAGEFENDTALSNSGEQLTLKARDGSVIQSFRYNDQAPWPASADGGGASLVLRKPSTNPDSGLSQNWRASVSAGGNPGGGDAVLFGGAATADIDGDGLSALMEYALGTSDLDPSDAGSVIQSDFNQGDLTLRWKEATAADDVILELESSSDLITWEAPGMESLPREMSAGPGPIVESVQAIQSEFREFYFRLKVSLR
jgi:hypothetical protein